MNKEVQRRHTQTSLRFLDSENVVHFRKDDLFSSWLTCNFSIDNNRLFLSRNVNKKTEIMRELLLDQLSSEQTGVYGTRVGFRIREDRMRYLEPNSSKNRKKNIRHYFMTFDSLEKCQQVKQQITLGSNCFQNQTTQQYFQLNTNKENRPSSLNLEKSSELSSRRPLSTSNNQPLSPILQLRKSSDKSEDCTDNASSAPSSNSEKEHQKQDFRDLLSASVSRDIPFYDISNLSPEENSKATAEECYAVQPKEYEFQQVNFNREQLKSQMNCMRKLQTRLKNKSVPKSEMTKLLNSEIILNSVIEVLNRQHDWNSQIAGQKVISKSSAGSYLIQRTWKCLSDNLNKWNFLSFIGKSFRTVSIFQNKKELFLRKVLKISSHEFCLIDYTSEDQSELGWEEIKQNIFRLSEVSFKELEIPHKQLQINIEVYEKAYQCDMNPEKLQEFYARKENYASTSSILEIQLARQYSKKCRQLKIE